MSNPRIPQQKFVAASNVLATETFLTEMATAFIFNSGAKDVWFKFDGVPAAADGDGQTRLPTGVAFNIPDCNYTSIGFLCAGVDTTGVQIIATQSPQDGSFN